MRIEPLSFGEYTRRLRRQKKISVLALSEQTGLSYSHLSRIENDSTMPSADAVARIATAIGGDLGVMLELANCLPEVILERIRGYQGTEPTPSLNRVGGLPSGESEAQPELRQLVAALASARGLDTAEATLIAQAIDRLVQLDQIQRAALARVILSIRPDEQASPQ